MQLSLFTLLQLSRCVSILTRPEGRVQLVDAVYPLPRGRFNPHPSRGTGATCIFVSLLINMIGFNPHPSRGTGATDCRLRGIIIRKRVSILTRPEGRVQLAVYFPALSPALVSILTRPEGRVQHFHKKSYSRLFSVSILTRPEGRVQPTEVVVVNPEQLVSILTRPEGRVQPSVAHIIHETLESFNPHPSRGTGATVTDSDKIAWNDLFQSSPVPRDGCNR